MLKCSVEIPILVKPRQAWSEMGQNLHAMFEGKRVHSNFLELVFSIIFIYSQYSCKTLDLIKKYNTSNCTFDLLIR